MSIELDTEFLIFCPSIKDPDASITLLCPNIPLPSELRVLKYPTTLLTLVVLVILFSLPNIPV